VVLPVRPLSVVPSTRICHSHWKMPAPLISPLPATLRSILVPDAALVNVARGRSFPQLLLTLVSVVIPEYTYRLIVGVTMAATPRAGCTTLSL